MSHHRAIALVFALHGGVAGSLATRIPWIQDHLGLSPALLGLVLLCQPIGAFIGMPTATRLAHKLGGRRATRLLLAVWCAALALPALAPAPVWLFAVFVGYGAAAGLCDVVMNSQAVVLERRLHKPIISGLHGLWCVGGLVGGGIGILAAHAGVDARVHLGLMAAVLLGLGIVVSRGLYDDPTAQDAPAPRRFALPTKAILAVGLVGFCGTFAEGASASWAAVYVTKVAAASPALAAATYTIFTLCMAATRLLADRVVLRFGPVAAVRASGVIGVLGGILVVTGRTPVLAITGFALLGVGVAAVVPLVFAAAGRAGADPGEGVAGVATITYLSGLIAPAITGWTAGALSYPAAFVLITAMVVVMAILAKALQPSSRAEVAKTPALV